MIPRAYWFYDSPIANNGYKGKFFIQISFSFRRYTGLQGSGTQHPVPLCSQNYEDKQRCMGGLTAGRLLDVELTPQLVLRY